MSPRKTAPSVSVRPKRSTKSAGTSRSSRSGEASLDAEMDRVRYEAQLILLAARLQAARLLLGPRGERKGHGRSVSGRSASRSSRSRQLTVRESRSLLGLEDPSGAQVVGKALDHLIGTWTAAEARGFEASVAEFGQIDKELWE